MFTLRYPKVIRFGWGCSQDLAAVVAEVAGPGTPVLVVRSNSAPPLVHGLNVAGTVAGIPGDPPLAEVDRVIAAVRDSGAGAVVAVGGGSVIDVAKAAALLAPAGGRCAEWFRDQSRLPARSLPLIAVPTTAGSGAEATMNAVLTDTEKGVKASLRSPAMVPAAAVVDPELTLSCPAGLTAACGLDAFTQAVESYISLRANEFTRPLASRSAALLLSNLESAVRDGQNRAARTAVAEGSLLSAMAFSQSGLGAVHGLAHPLGLMLKLPHGFTCAVLLPHVLEINRPVSEAALAELAAAAGIAGGADGYIRTVRALCLTLGIPETFAAAGLVPEQFPAILKNCRSNSMVANPRPLSDDEILTLLGELAANKRKF